jgi:hypothetical protein
MSRAAVADPRMSRRKVSARQRAGERARPRPARGRPACSEHRRRRHSGRGRGDLAVCCHLQGRPRPGCARCGRHRDAGRRLCPGAVAAGLGPAEPSPQPLRRSRITLDAAGAVRRREVQSWPRRPAAAGPRSWRGRAILRAAVSVPEFFAPEYCKHGAFVSERLPAADARTATGIFLAWPLHRSVQLRPRSGRHAALAALLWAGLVRAALLRHVTWSVNSLCHVIGTRPFTSAG